MLKKLNFFIEEDIRRELDRMVPVGKKSKVINDALRKELLRIKRGEVTEKLLALKAKGPKIRQEELVEELKRDRRRNN
ncbi:MAG TPA: hypothetical protein VI387_02355 [Candidatus Brocadiales bacterium]|nr:hypothetical protein [Candidatus Brocadiales bacterium]